MAADGIPPDDTTFLDACFAFDRALRSGERVQAEEFASRIPEPHPSGLLLELLVTEIEFARESDPTFDPAAVYARFPAQPDLVRRALTEADVSEPTDSPLVVGPYRLEVELGRGATGSVFLGRHTPTGERVAVKVPHPAGLFDADTRGRFLAEARAAQRLDHPHVVPVIAVGSDGPVSYVVSRFVDGPSLDRWLDGLGGAVVPPRQAADLVLPLADAIAHAHSRGVLHLDLTPGNILLDEGAALTPRLTDFGFARLTDATGGTTPTGAIAGTPGYMAPEQAVDRSGVSEATDVYALGAVLYRLLAGRPPVAEASVPATLLRTTRGYPPSPRHFRREVPPELEAVCLRCLEREPRRRYPSAGAVADDLRRFLAGRPTAARPLGLRGRFRWWFGRDPAAAVIRLIVGAAAGVIAGLLVWHLVSLSAANRRLDEANQ